MKTGRCRCGAKVFFANTKCVTCNSMIGCCEGCRSITSFTVPDDSSTQLTSTCDVCGLESKPCANQQVGVCNCMLPSSSANELCEWCVYTEVVPCLEQESTLERWKDLEKAKRQLLDQVYRLGLPPSRVSDLVVQPLRFRFMEDEVDQDGNIVPIYTGHCQGIITINIQEADSVYREKTRVLLGEPLRTLIGHLRHEYGHYLDWCLPEARRPEYVAMFGDPIAIPYEEAKQAYYSQTTPKAWATDYVSQYASMHPWEDFAETVTLYLDMMALLMTASDQDWPQFKALSDGSWPEISQVVTKSLEIAVAVSEFNSDLGLPHLLPKNISDPVVEKLGFVHSLIPPAPTVVSSNANPTHTSDASKTPETVLMN